MRLPRGLEILHEDQDILVVNKPAGLLTMGTGTSRPRTVSHLLTEYVRRGRLKSRQRIHIVHRLDQWTSGVLVFAKSEDVMLRLKAQWQNTEKDYIAVVHGHLARPEGIVSSYLFEDKEYVVHSTMDVRRGKLAHTAYSVLAESRQFSLLEIHLLTGRKNQIRVHMADEGHPVVGDRKYGKADDGYGRLALHAKLISFRHPTSGAPMTFEAELPDFFRELIDKSGMRYRDRARA